MGRTYAGVLGALAFATVILHGALHAAGLEATVGKAAVMMIVFGAVGFLVGRIAQATVEESVRAKMAEQLAVRAAESAKTAASPAASA